MKDDIDDNKEQPFVITDKQKQAEYIWQYLQDICNGKEK